MSKRTIWSSDFDMEDWKEAVPELIADGCIKEDATEEEIEEYCRNLHFDYLDDEKANLNFPCELLVVGSIQLWNRTVDGFMVLDNLNKCFDASGVDADCTVDVYVDTKTDRMYGRFAHHDAPMGYTLEFFIIKENASASFRKCLEENIPFTQGQLNLNCIKAGKKVREIYGF